MITGITRNCECCHANYGQYNEKKENNFNEYWCELPNLKDEFKGLCQFCNPSSKFYVKARVDKFKGKKYKVIDKDNNEKIINGETLQKEYQIV